MVDVLNSLDDRTVACDSFNDSKIDSTILCTVELLFKLFKLPFLVNHHTTTACYTIYIGGGERAVAYGTPTVLRVQQSAAEKAMPTNG